MHLTNGCYYTNAEGRPVRCQLHGDGYFHIFDVEGNEIQKVPLTTVHEATDENEKDIKISTSTHVEGWTPIGASQFNIARKKKLTARAKKASKKKKRFKDRVKDKQEEGDEKAQAEDAVEELQKED